MRILRRGWKIVIAVTVLGLLLLYFLDVAQYDVGTLGYHGRRLVGDKIYEVVNDHGHDQDELRTTAARVEIRPPDGHRNQSEHDHDDDDDDDDEEKVMSHDAREQLPTKLTTLPKEKAYTSVPNVSFDVCKNARLLPPRSRPLIALASVPGSGNTWVRYLLERASGIYTGSVYMDKALFEGGFKGELVNPRSGRTLVVKTHDTGTSDTTRHYKGAVVIVRNPYNTLLAYANLLKGGHTGYASREFFESEGWDSFVKSASVSWEDRITTWVTRPNVVVVFHEQLKVDLRHEVARLLDFLRVPVDQARLDCMAAYPEGAFHRKHNHHGTVKNETSKSRTMDPYKDRHRAIIEEHVRSASKVLRSAGHIDYDLFYSGLDR